MRSCQNSVDVLVVALGDALVAAAIHVHQDRRRHRHLRHRARVGLEELEGAHDRARPPADRPVDPEAREGLLLAVGRVPGEGGRALPVRADALPGQQQFQPPAAPPELAVGDGAEADAFLHGDDVADAAILDRAQLGVVMGSEMLVGCLGAEELLARRLEDLGPEQAADLVGAERRARGAISVTRHSSFIFFWANSSAGWRGTPCPRGLRSPRASRQTPGPRPSRSRRNARSCHGRVGADRPPDRRARSGPAGLSDADPRAGRVGAARARAHRAHLRRQDD